MRRKRRLGIVVILICLLLGAVGCMHTKANVQKEMLNYLEEKYGETFEVEYFDKGDMFFPEIYGGDEMMAYPTNNPDIPFYIFQEDEETSGFYDLYVPSYISYQYTEQHRQDIIAMDSREMAMKFAFSSENRPVDANVLKRPLEDVIRDANYNFHIHLFLAIKKEGDLDVQTESAFLYRLYTYMEDMKIEGGEVHLAIAYVEPDLFNEAQQLIRISHAINFGWYLLGDEDVLNAVYFGSNVDIKDSTYFNKFFE